MLEVINIFAIVVSPIIAIYVGSYFQDRAEKRKDKMMLFKTILATRIYGWTYESVNALNLIDIVFFDENKVRLAWKNLYDKYALDGSVEDNVDIIKNAQNELYITMAIALGYEDKIVRDVIEKPYLPNGLAEAQKQEQQYKKGQLEIMRQIQDIICGKR